MNIRSQPPDEAQSTTTAVNGNEGAVPIQSNETGSAATATVPLRPTRQSSALSALHATFQNTFSSLYNPRYLIFWLGMVFLMGGTQMQLLARGYLVYDITGSGLVLGYVNLGIAVPMLTIPLFGGAIADRFDRITIIQGSQMVAAILALVVGIMIDTNTVAWPHLMVASMVQGGLFAFLMPARQAIIPTSQQRAVTQCPGPKRGRHERHDYGCSGNGRLAICQRRPLERLLPHRRASPDSGDNDYIAP